MWYCTVYLVLICILTNAECRKAPVQIAFGIMTYQKKGESTEHAFSAFSRLMTSIYNPENHIYILHVDSKSSKELVRAIHEDFCDANFHNCGYIRPRNVGWGAPTVVEMNMALMQAAYEFPKLQYNFTDALGRNPTVVHRSQAPKDWDYFIFLGHESVSLVTLNYIEQFLGSVRNGILLSTSTTEISDENKSDNKVARQIPFSVYPEGTNFINCWHAYGHNFYGQWEDVHARLESVVVDSHNGFLIENLHWLDRRTGKYHEFKRAIPQDLGFEIFKTIQYIGLTNEACKFILYGPDTRQILLYLANVKASDELVIPTIFQRNATLANTATCDNTLHFMHWVRPGGSWHPEYVTMEHLPLMMNTTKHLFIRKVNSASADVLDALSEVRALAWQDLASLVVPGPQAHMLRKDAPSYGRNSRGQAYVVLPATPIHPRLLPPLQHSWVMEALSRSSTFIHRCIQHIILVGMGTKFEGSEQNHVPSSGDEEFKGSVQDKALQILHQLFPSFSWISARNSSDNHLANGEVEHRELRSEQDGRLHALSVFRQNWDAGNIPYKHVSLATALARLNDIRIRRDAIEEEKFIAYWTKVYSDRDNENSQRKGADMKEL